MDAPRGKAQRPQLRSQQAEEVASYPQVSPRLKATLRERRAGETLRGRAISSHQALSRSTENFKTEIGMDPMIKAGKEGTWPRKAKRSSQVMDQQGI